MTAQQLFDEIAATLVDLGARRSQMMGRPMLVIQRRMFACLSEERLCLKLGRASAEHAAALSLPGATLFHPGGGERVFKDWVALPVDAAEEWERLAVAAFEHVQG